MVRFIRIRIQDLCLSSIRGRDCQIPVLDFGRVNNEASDTVWEGSSDGEWDAVLKEDLEKVVVAVVVTVKID
ncbi:MAG: hypothetical protein ACP5FZ_03090 [Fidelibacterota bacterium]